MRIFITGVSGLFGLNAALVLGDKGHEVWGSYLTHPVELPGGRAVRLDVREGVEVLRVFRDIKPEVVIHAAALTNVDACEENPAMARELNVDATRAVVKAVADFDVRARLVYLSTDQVFDGTTQFATERTRPNPINEYGRTKLHSEDVVASEASGGAFLIIRTNFFGWGPPHRPSLSDWILGRLRAGSGVPGFEDVFFTPILVNELIERVEFLLASGVRGLFHVTGAERVSKYEFARRLAEAFGLDPTLVKPIQVAKAGLRARRPLDMSLDGRKADKLFELFGFPPAKLEFGLAQLKGLEVQGWPDRIRSMIAQPRQVSA